MIIKALNLTGAAFCFRAACSRCSGPSKLAQSFGGGRRLAALLSSSLVPTSGGDRGYYRRAIPHSAKGG
jgi:hypothetical protein